MNQKDKENLKNGGAIGLLGALGTLGAAGLTTGIAASMLFSKTLPRPKQTSQDIIDEFADRAKMEEYMVKMAPVLMALGVPEIQATVSAVIADCAYTSPADIFGSVIQKDYHLLPAHRLLQPGRPHHGRGCGTRGEKMPGQDRRR